MYNAARAVGADTGRVWVAHRGVIVAGLEVDPLARIERRPLVRELPDAVDPGIEEAVGTRRPAHMPEEVVVNVLLHRHSLGPDVGRVVPRAVHVPAVAHQRQM